MTNFWQALEQVDQSQPRFDFEYRLYYDPKTGEPLFYTTQDETGTYLIVDKQFYEESRYDIYIKNSKIQRIKHESLGKLVPAETGVATHPQDITIISNTEQSTYWNTKTYEFN